MALVLMRVNWPAVEVQYRLDRPFSSEEETAQVITKLRKLCPLAAEIVEHPPLKGYKGAIVAAVFSVYLRNGLQGAIGGVLHQLYILDQHAANPFVPRGVIAASVEGRKEPYVNWSWRVPAF